MKSGTTLLFIRPFFQGGSLRRTTLLTLPGLRILLPRRGYVRTVSAMKNRDSLRMPDCENVAPRLFA